MLRLTIRSEPLAVRNGLRELLSSAPMRQMTRTNREVVEIVFAEVLNNIVEHAYGAESGEIAIAIATEPGLLRCRICDQGRPMPGLELPSGALCDASALPEGGFGWHLIRTLAGEMHYQRIDRQNVLCFTLPC